MYEGPLLAKTTFDAENFIMQVVPVYDMQFAFEMCVATQNRQKIHKIPYFGVQSHPRSLLLAFNANRKPVYDFLLMINNLILN